MKYREQLEHELKQTESQLKKLEEAEKSKMRERNQVSLIYTYIRSTQYF